MPGAISLPHRKIVEGTLRLASLGGLVTIINGWIDEAFALEADTGP